MTPESRYTGTGTVPLYKSLSVAVSGFLDKSALRDWAFLAGGVAGLPNFDLAYNR